jgi:hypothetical protein
MSKPISIRLDRELVAALRKLARRFSYERDQELTWVDLLNHAARKFIQEQADAAGATPS